MLVSMAFEKIANFADDEDAAAIIGTAPGRKTIGELRKALLQASPNDLVIPTPDGEGFTMQAGPGNDLSEG